ncbi:MAG: hypothetical protein ACLFPO_13710 [Spirochaetaceae bacterium]
MKNITFSGDDQVIERAREKAEKENTNLNSLFREWLREYVEDTNRVEEFDTLSRELDYANAGRRFSRDELNAR